jgi:GPI mannosyltransferase 3
VKEILQSKYSPLFIAGLALVIICSWFSIGFYQADEHFQILEFCNYKMGHSPATDLCWEYQQKARASLLPGIAYLVGEVMNWCNLYNPFTLAFLLRLFTAIAGWFITSKMCLLLLPKLKNPVSERLLILMSFFLWFMPYLAVRFTPENVSGIILLYALYLILSIDEKTTAIYARYMAAGLFFGIAFFIRFQVAFAIGGFVAWSILINKTNWKYIMLLAISILMAIGINILIDHWFYRAWTFTPFNYYYANIIQHKAASFGVNPWWYYFYAFFIAAAPPISVILLILFFVGTFKNLKDSLLWVIIPFIVPHFFIGHKELRFLFPVTFIFTYCSALGLDYFLAKRSYRLIFKYVYPISLIICIPLLIYRTLIPAQVPINYCKFLYTNTPAKGNTLFVLNSDYDMTIYGLFSGIYKPPALKIIKMDSLKQISNYLNTTGIKSALFINKESTTFHDTVAGYRTTMVYCFFPSWVLKFDVNNWEERSSIWKIYQFTKIE